MKRSVFFFLLPLLPLPIVREKQPFLPKNSSDQHFLSSIVPGPMVLIWARFSCPLLSSWWIRDPEFISTFHPENHFLLVKDEFFFESLPNSLPLTACLSNISFLSFFSSCRSCGREHGVINFLLSLTYSIMDLSNDKKEVLSCCRLKPRSWNHQLSSSSSSLSCSYISCILGIILSLLIWDQQTISSSISSLILGSLLYLGRGMVCWEEKEGS